jgi:hypothetical protein
MEKMLVVALTAEQAEAVVVQFEEDGGKNVEEAQIALLIRFFLHNPSSNLKRRFEDALTKHQS